MLAYLSGPIEFAADGGKLWRRKLTPFLHNDLGHRVYDAGKRVIVTGLDTDYLGRPFEPMPRLLAAAEEIIKLLAICVQCGNPAVHTQRLVASEDLIVVGAAGMYEPRCRRCFEPHLAHDWVEANKNASSGATSPTSRHATTSD